MPIPPIKNRERKTWKGQKKRSPEGPRALSVQQQVLQELSQVLQQLLLQQPPLKPPHMKRSSRTMIIQKQPPLLFPQNMLRPFLRAMWWALAAPRAGGTAVSQRASPAVCAILCPTRRRGDMGVMQMQKEFENENMPAGEKIPGGHILWNAVWHQHSLWESGFI